MLNKKSLCYFLSSIETSESIGGSSNILINNNIKQSWRGSISEHFLLGDFNMIVIPPIQIQEANLVSSSILEPSTGEIVWAAATSYAVGDVVIRTTTHRKYECQIAGVDAGLPENTPTRWLDIGPTNKWAMFDLNRNMQSTANDSITFTVAPMKRINTVALLGLQAKAVTITMKVGANIVYGPETRNLNSRLTLTWTDYFFGEFGYAPSLILTDLPPFSGATVEVTLSNPGLPVECSTVVIGSKVFLGKIQFNARSDALNFSKIERDDFGNSLLIPRRTVPKTQQTLWVEKDNVNTIRQVRKDLNAVPALWSGLDENFEDEYFESILIFGIYKQMEIDLAHEKVALLNMELEEL